MAKVAVLRLQLTLKVETFLQGKVLPAPPAAAKGSVVLELYFDCEQTSESLEKKYLSWVSETWPHYKPPPPPLHPHAEVVHITIEVC